MIKLQIRINCMIIASISLYFSVDWESEINSKAIPTSNQIKTQSVVYVNCNRLTSFHFDKSCFFASSCLGGIIKKNLYLLAKLGKLMLNRLTVPIDTGDTSQVLWELCLEIFLSNCFLPAHQFSRLIQFQTVMAACPQGTNWPPNSDLWWQRSALN